MRFGYVIDPVAYPLIERAPIKRKIDRLIDERRFFYTGSLNDSNLLDYLEGMEEDGYYATREGIELAKRIREMIEHPRRFAWRIGKSPIEVPVEYEHDVTLMMGLHAADVLTPRQFWNFERFEFSSTTDLAGTVGAILLDAEKKLSERGYEWRTQTIDGRTIATKVGGSMHNDLRIYRNDVTIYETTDPLGNIAHYRPLRSQDARFVSAYHSTEGALLAAILKYIEQAGIESNTYADRFKDVIQWTKSLGQHGGTTAEHFGGNEQRADMFFVPWDIPLPTTDSDYETDERSPDGLFTENHGAYEIFIGPNKELVLRYRSQNDEKDKPIVFYPHEVDDLIKGLLYQSAMGLSRTSANELISVLNYRFAKNFREWAQRDLNPRPSS